jgi:hypothetical protein
LAKAHYLLLLELLESILRRLRLMKISKYNYEKLLFIYKGYIFWEYILDIDLETIALDPNSTLKADFISFEGLDELV